VRSGRWVATADGVTADETKKEYERGWGVGHCCYLSKGAFEQLDLDLMASNAKELQIFNKLRRWILY